MTTILNQVGDPHPQISTVMPVLGEAEERRQEMGRPIIPRSLLSHLARKEFTALLEPENLCPRWEKNSGCEERRLVYS